LIFTMSQTVNTINNNVVDYYTNSEGDLFLKYFLADSTFNSRGWAIDASKIETMARKSIGAPFTDYEDFPTTLFKDQHPWNPNPNATFKDHYDYAANKATGFIVDFSPVSRNALKSASGMEIENNHGMYVTVKVVDPIKKKLYIEHPERIPKCSPGVLDHDFKNVEHGKTVLENIDLVHLAGVERGAYGEKARVYAKCQGGYECVNHLKGASELSSLGENLTQNTDIMSDQVNTLSTVQNGQENNELSTQPQQTNEQPQEQKRAQELVDAEINTNNNENTPTEETNQNNADSKQQDKTSKSPFRLKTAKFDFQKELQNPNKESKVPNWKEDPEYVKLAKEVAKLKEEKEIEKNKAKYAAIVPKELFVLNGKFDSIGYNKEIEKAVNKNVDPEYAAELYKLKLEKLKLSTSKGKPYGASEYKTPDTVPDNSNNDLKGASEISSQFNGLNNICRMFGLLNNNKETS